MTRTHWWKLIVGFCLAVLISIASHHPLLAQNNPRPIITFNSSVLWRPVYARLPYLPLENQYSDDPEENFVSRLIRYHTGVKNRQAGLRFDWKLTIADYLGANEPILEERYPGATTLRTNPLPGDRAVINRLTRTQREELVNTLVLIHGREAEPAAIIFPRTATVTNPTPRPSPSFVLPQPGDAQLLRLR